MRLARKTPLAIAVLGLGRVGLVTATSLAAAGHHVLGIDRRGKWLAELAAGRLGWREPGLEELLRRVQAQGRLRLQDALEPALADLDLVAICVETPAGPEGRLDCGPLLVALASLASGLRARPADAPPLLCVVRSTVPIGATEELLLPSLVEGARSAPGEKFELALNPEFLREGTALADHRSPSRIVIGERLPGVTRRLLGIYDATQAPIFEVGYREAETIKLLDNAFHALKVAFANEFGRLALAFELAPARLAELFLADGKLNLSAAYLRPGMPYGGPCLPKDLRALLAAAHARGLALPLLEAVEASNRLHLTFLVERIRALVPPPGPLLLLGLSFKEGVEDVRGSPPLALLTALVADGYKVEVVDPELERAPVLALPRGARLHGRAALARLAAEARLLVLAKRPADLLGMVPPELPILDLVRLELRTPAEAGCAAASFDARC